MIQRQSPADRRDVNVEALCKQLQERTFGRLHNLNIVRLPDGRLHVSAVAHSRFVGQLAEWAVMELTSPEDVIVSIRVLLSPSQLPEDQK
jgi:hypothetical protein